MLNYVELKGARPVHKIKTSSKGFLNKFCVR